MGHWGTRVGDREVNASLLPPLICLYPDLASWLIRAKVYINYVSQDLVLQIDVNVAYLWAPE